MSSHYPPLTCKQVKAILKDMGFSKKTEGCKPGTSHEKWQKVIGNKKFIVTVDCPKEPFTGRLLKYMCQQAGVSKKEFYSYLKK